MIARSVEDTNNIKKIIRVLKYHQYPELTMDNFLWIYPAEFDVVHYYRDKPNEYMPRHATSVLQEVSVNYGDGEDVMNLHYDGSPLNVGLELRFTEIVQLNKASILQGY